MPNDNDGFENKKVNTMPVKSENTSTDIIDILKEYSDSNILKNKTLSSQTGTLEIATQIAMNQSNNTTTKTGDRPKIAIPDKLPEKKAAKTIPGLNIKSETSKYDTISKNENRTKILPNNTKLEFNVTEKAEYIPKPPKPKKKPKSDADTPEAVANRAFDKKVGFILRLIFVGISLLTEIYITFAEDFGLPIFDSLTSVSPQSYIFTQFVLLAVAVTAMFDIIKKSFVKLLHFKADTDTPLVLISISGVISQILLSFSPSFLYLCENFSMLIMLSFLFNLFGKILAAQRVILNCEILKKSTLKKFSVEKINNQKLSETLTMGTTGKFPEPAVLRRGRTFVDIEKNSYSENCSDKLMKFLVPIMSIISLAAAVYFTLNNETATSFWEIFYSVSSIFTVFAAVSFGLIMPIIPNLPLLNAAKSLTKENGMVLGWKSVRDHADDNFVVIDADLLFPFPEIEYLNDESIPNNFVNINREIYIVAANISNIFSKAIMKEKRAFFKNWGTDDISDIEYESGYGFSGLVNNRRFQLGNIELMKKHNIEGLLAKHTLAEFDNEGGVIYFALSGMLIGTFELKLSADKNVKDTMQELAKNGYGFIIRSMDECLSVNKISTLFGIPEKHISIISQKHYNTFDNLTNPVKTKNSSTISSYDFSTFGKMLLALKNIKKLTNVGIILNCVAIIMGFSFTALYYYLGAPLSASFIGLYNLVWATVIGLLLGPKV
ncbi:MAG: hypothetical protein LBL93_01720 [Ruminococcus sp.]|nr:hypothetical protein [Ruminococcus sp.]